MSVYRHSERYRFNARYHRIPKSCGICRMELTSHHKAFHVVTLDDINKYDSIA